LRESVCPGCRSGAARCFCPLRRPKNGDDFAAATSRSMPLRTRHLARRQDGSFLCRSLICRIGFVLFHRFSERTIS
jgi:hypothetical protein